MSFYNRIFIKLLIHNPICMSRPQHHHLPRFESSALFPDSVRSADLLERWHSHPDEEAAKAAEQAAPDRISQVSMS